MKPLPDIDSMSIDDLWLLREEVDRALSDRLNDEIRQLEAKLQALDKPPKSKKLRRSRVSD
jgi:hypothetical protein